VQRLQLLEGGGVALFLKKRVLWRDEAGEIAQQYAQRGAGCSQRLAAQKSANHKEAEAENSDKAAVERGCGGAEDRVADTAAWVLAGTADSPSAAHSHPQWVQWQLASGWPAASGASL